MAKKVKIAILLLGVYLLVFGIGFKAGGMYLRMQRKVEVERIMMPAPPRPVFKYYIVERQDRGTYKDVKFMGANGDDNIIAILFENEALRPLLKASDIEIYKDNGERVY